MSQGSAVHYSHYQCLLGMLDDAVILSFQAGDLLLYYSERYNED
jgi:hypothetical protein